MGVRGKRQGNPWGCQGEGFPCGFPRSGRRLDSFDLPSARRADAGRRECGADFGGAQWPYVMSRTCAGAVRRVVRGFEVTVKYRVVGGSRRASGR